MFNVLVYSDKEKYFEKAKSYGLQGPFFEIRIPYERLSYCNQEEVNDLVKELGVKILQFMNSAEQSSVRYGPKKLFSYAPLSKEDYEEAFMVRNLDDVEEEVTFGDM